MIIFYTSMMKILTTFLLVFSVGNCIDYCRFCENHIACNNDGTISEKCRSNSEIVGIALYKNFILGEHNKNRNEIALGKVPNFEPASRMATMEWDDELANLAEMNVKTCDIQRDECRITQRFLNVEQNIGMMAFGGLNLKEFYWNLIDQWFHEHQDANMSIINKYYYDEKAPSFTIMVDDRNFRIGCATLKTHDRISNKFVTTCNYATGNMKGFPIYRKGPTASGCKTGVNPKYPGLCSVKEQIDVDDYYN